MTATAATITDAGLRPEHPARRALLEALLRAFPPGTPFTAGQAGPLVGRHPTTVAEALAGWRARGRAKLEKVLARHAGGYGRGNIHVWTLTERAAADLAALTAEALPAYRGRCTRGRAQRPAPGPAPTPAADRDPDPCVEPFPPGWFMTATDRAWLAARRASAPTRARSEEPEHGADDPGV